VLVCGFRYHGRLLPVHILMVPNCASTGHIASSSSRQEAVHYKIVPIIAVIIIAVMTRPIFHTLASARPSALFRTLVRHGGFAPRYAPQIALAFLASVMQSASFALESAWVAPRVKHVVFDPPPIFIVGHWRSGTTYLHNLMSRDPRFIFPTVLDTLRPDLFFPGILEGITRRLLVATLPPTRPMDDVPIRCDLPQEEEWALAIMGVESFVNCFFFPRHRTAIFAREVLFEGWTPEPLQVWDDRLRCYLAKLILRAPQRRLLLKNPAHSARILHLRELFPGAKFIHIHRDPLAVIKSTIKMHRRMIARVALQNDDANATESFALWAYPQVMDRLLDGLAALPTEDVTELRYDDLLRDPVLAVKSIYSALEVGEFAQAHPQIEASVAEFKAVLPDAQIGDAATDARILHVVAPYMARLGYTGN
jgi:omega-hydroxy-beta-dihydromenaquinone-9 sulfotransferase